MRIWRRRKQEKQNEKELRKTKRMSRRRRRKKGIFGRKTRYGKFFYITLVHNHQRHKKKHFNPSSSLSFPTGRTAYLGVDRFPCQRSLVTIAIKEEEKEKEEEEEKRSAARFQWPLGPRLC